MKDLAILIPCWKGSDYLPACLSAIKQNCESRYEVFVILNEADQLSIDICKWHKVRFIALDVNVGTLAVDFAIPFLKDFKYVANLNIDMLVCPSWDSILITRLMGLNDFGTVSSPAVEYKGGNNGIDTINDPTLPKFNSPECLQLFSNNVSNGKYKFPDVISQRHPTICSVENFLKVGGYSDNWDFNFFPGYSLDFDFPYRLWKRLGISKMISVGSAPVLHDYSSTMKKLPPNLQSRNCWDYFHKKNSITIDEFKKKIGFLSNV